MTEDIKKSENKQRKTNSMIGGTEFRLLSQKISELKKEQEIPPQRRPSSPWNSWLPYLLVAFGLLALFSDFRF